MLSRCRAAALAVLACTLIVLAPVRQGVAGEWVVEPRLSGSVSYTDNVDLDATQKSGDVVMRVTPGLTIEGVGSRARVVVDYDGSFLWFVDEGREQWRNNLLSSFFLEPVRDYLFFDARFTIAQPTINERDSVSFSNDNFSANRRQTIGISAAPYLRHQLGDFADVEWRYTFRYVNVAGPPNSDPMGERINDYINHAVQVRLDSGDRFGRLRWDINAFYDVTDRQFSGRTGEDIRARFNAEYRVVRWLGILGSVGWERIDAPGFAGIIDDVTWNGGLRFNPTRNTDISVTYGRDAGDNSFDVEARHTRKRFEFVLSYNENITTSQRRFVEGLDGGSFNDDGIFVDGLGNPVNPDDLVFGFTNDAFRLRRLAFETRYEHRRTTISMRAYYDRRTFRPSDDGIDPGPGPVVLDTLVREVGGYLEVERRFSPKATGTIELHYEYTDFERGPGRADNFYGARASFSYDISQYVTGVLSYVFWDRNSNDNAFDSTSNTVTLSAQARF